jgi:hypothetical protein
LLVVLEVEDHKTLMLAAVVVVLVVTEHRHPHLWFLELRIP